MSTPARVDPPTVTVHPATPDRGDDVAAVLGRRNGDPSTCWCRRFLIDPRRPTTAQHCTATKVGTSGLFTGTLAMFEAKGYAEIGRSHPSRPVMRHPLG